MGGYIGRRTTKRLYRFTDETSINVMSGDSYVPQGGYALRRRRTAAATALTADPDSPIRYDHNSLGAGTVALCAGSM